jgi:hypothetical protein
MTYGAYGKIEVQVDFPTGVECEFWVSSFCIWACK